METFKVWNFKYRFEASTHLFLLSNVDLVTNKKRCLFLIHVFVHKISNR